ncbi:MAG TPA: hypothetical protein VGM51_01960 [Armatimonadota bacterium]|jgi:hypothetical protein
MRFHRTTLVASAALCLAPTVPSHAIPVFARKYGFNCTMCHSNFPRLNDYGQRYRMNGYRLMGREDEEKTVYETPAPLALRTSATFNSDKFTNTPGSNDVKQFQVNNLDILSAGLLDRNIGYMLVYPPKIEASRGVVGQPGTLEMASVVLSNPKTSWLNVRAGRFEPGALAFSVKRSLTFSPYEIYNFTFPGGTPLSDTQTGVELAGFARGGTAYTAGWLNGAATNNDNQSADDFYIHATHVIGPGEGQTAGQRIGLMGYAGKAKPSAFDGPTDRKAISRIGVDASLNFKQVNLALQYLHGKDDKALWGTADDVKYSGGFAELSFLPSTRIVGFGRYDWVKTPRSVSAGIKRWTIGGRYYLADSMAIHAEYSDRRQAQPDDDNAKERLFVFGLDFGI